MSNEFIQDSNLVVKKKIAQLKDNSLVVVDADLRKYQFPDKTFFPSELNNSLSVENYRHNTVVIFKPSEYGYSDNNEALTVNTFIPDTVDESNQFNEFYAQYVPINGAILELRFWLGNEDLEKRHLIKPLTLIDVQRPITYHFYQISNDYKVDFDFDSLGASHPLEYYVNMPDNNNDDQITNS